MKSEEEGEEGEEEEEGEEGEEGGGISVGAHSRV